MAQLILRVDDIGWRPDKSADAGLEYFSAWRKAAGLAGLPVYYGAIPSCISPAELDWFRKNLTGLEELSVHGFDHARNATVMREQMISARERFRLCRSYIPPFNAYTPATVRDWALATKHLRSSYFFGGFPIEHHNYGPYPTPIDSHTIHLPAFRALYDHTKPLIERLESGVDIQCPLVVTLHCTWGHAEFELLPLLTHLLKPHLVPVDRVEAWLNQSRPDLRRLQAAQYYSQRWVLDRVRIGEKVLDFGARCGELPSQMALRGCRVWTVDRDPMSPIRQQEVASKFGVELTTYHATSVDSLGSECFDTVTATWAIQHNLPGETEIPKVAAAIARRIKPGGRLLIVSSHATKESFDQLARLDPQRILNWPDHQRLVIEPSGCKLAGMPFFFQYEHGTTRGGKCDQSVANAVAYELRKPE